MLNKKKQEFWDSRSTLGKQAGTNDFILKEIEMKLLLKLVRQASSVLDVGCGNGDTLFRLAQENHCTGLGIDFSPQMINAAQKTLQETGLTRQISFQEGLVPGLKAGLGQFDYVITERCLINLDDLESQYRAFEEIMRHVKPDGRYLMIEDSLDGLNKLNQFRQQLGLETMLPPWHNTYFNEKDVKAWESGKYTLEQFLPFTSTYYFLSRVIYARLAKDKNEELKYDSDINLLSLDLPVIGDLGAARMWVWKHNSGGRN